MISSQLIVSCRYVFHYTGRVMNVVPECFIFTLVPFRPKGIFVPCAVCPSVRPSRPRYHFMSHNIQRILFISGTTNNLDRIVQAIDYRVFMSICTLSRDPHEYWGRWHSFGKIHWHFKILRIHWLTCFLNYAGRGFPSSGRNFLFKKLFNLPRAFVAYLSHHYSIHSKGYYHLNYRNNLRM